MNITRKINPYTITCAIAQMVGELDQLGQTVKLADIAAFLGCTKATAQKYTTKAIWSKKLVCVTVPYRQHRMFTYKLGVMGDKCFNSDNWKLAKHTVLVAKGIIE